MGNAADLQRQATKKSVPGFHPWNVKFIPTQLLLELTETLQPGLQLKPLLPEFLQFTIRKHLLVLWRCHHM